MAARTQAEHRSASGEQLRCASPVLCISVSL